MAARPSMPTIFVRHIWREFQEYLPPEEELIRRLETKQRQLAQNNCSFDDPCEGIACSLLDPQSSWNALLNPGGTELRCPVPGHLNLTMLPVPLVEHPVLAKRDYEGDLLVVLWLLSRHTCIDRIYINTDVVFGKMTRVFYGAVQLGPHLKVVKLVRLFQKQEEEEAEINGQFLSKALARTRSLDSLTLGGLVLSQLAVSNLCQTFSLNENIAHVCLKNVQLSHQSSQVILVALNECKELNTVEFDFRVAIPEVPKALVELLTTNTSVVELTYEVDTAIHFPFRALNKNRTLKMLRVGRLVRDEDNIASLGLMLQRNTHLCVLSIGVCTRERHGEQWGVFTRGVGRNVGLVELDLHRSVIVDEVAQLLASMLYENKTLLKLNLETNRLTGKAAAYLADALVSNTTLKELRLGRLEGKMIDLADFYRILENSMVSGRVYAQFGPALIPMMIRLLRENQCLPEINISGIESSPPPLVSLLIGSIRVDMILTSLKLTLSTTLTSGSAECLATLFRDSVVLRNVELNMTVMELESGLLLEALQASTSIDKLRIKSWCFDEYAANTFVELLKRNRSISHLILFKPRAATFDVTVRLPEGLQDNYTLLTIDLFEDDHSRVINSALLSLLRRNYYRMTRAAEFFQGTLADQESADDFRKFASSAPLVKRLKEVSRSSEEDIVKAIAKRLEDMNM